MAFGPRPDDIRALCMRLGVKVLREFVLPDGEHAFEADAVTHERKVELLAELAELDGRTAAVRRVAERIITGARSTREQIERLHRFVQDAVIFTGEPQEIFSSAMHTIQVGAGDCDDSARALLALLRSLDIRAGLRTLPEGGTPLHVAPVVNVDGEWQWAETSIPAELGEHPIDAARRLGINTRPELGQLGSVPRDTNTPELGYRRSWIVGDVLALGVGIGGVLGYVYGALGPVSAGAAVGGAVGWGLYDWPLVSDYGRTSDKSGDERPCSSMMLDSETPDCQRQWGMRKAAAVALGGGAGAGIGYALKRARWLR